MHEACGVFGARSSTDVFDTIYYGVHSLQHRGQESAGMALFTDKIRVHKEMGLVSEVFKNTYMDGYVGIGHVRYSTTGESNIENAQPLLINYAKGSFAIAHNGNVINSGELKELLESKGNIFTTTTDTEVIAQLIVRGHIHTGSLVDGILEAMKHLQGSYSVVMLYDDKLIAIRDPHGIRPLVLGKSEDTYVLASETCALDVMDIKFVRDIKPSEILVIDENLKSYSGVKERAAHCMFEYVYFARPDSTLNGIPVYAVRKNLGMALAQEGKVKADLVVAVPDSGITTAIGYAEESGIPYSEALIKNKYIGRTFILPEQKQRDMGVKVKLNPIASEINDRELVLVDDSLVRGTTIKRLVRLLKDNGAKKIHLRISCPPIRHPCPYGIDMQTTKEFIASKKSIEDIRKMTGSDSLVYTSLSGLVKSIGLPKDKLCLGCLIREYPIREKQIKLTDL